MNPLSDKLLWDACLSALHYPALSVADEIGLFVRLGGGEKTLGVLANELSVSEHAATALTRVLAALGFLSITDDKIALTTESKTYLLPGSGLYWGGFLSFGRGKTDQVRLLQALKDSNPQQNMESTGLTEMWEKGTLTSEVAVGFTAGMHSHTYGSAIGAAKSGCFDGITSLVDVGGGSGCFCFALAERYPQAQFTVFELPVVCDLVKKYAAEAGVSKRVLTKSGNFFKDPIPSGHDGILFSNIFHDWGTARSEKFAKASFESLVPGGKIFIHEMLFDESGSGPLAAASFSLLMMINHGQGKQFRASELVKILTEAGFERVKVTSTFGYYSVVSGEKPS